MDDRRNDRRIIELDEIEDEIHIMPTDDSGQVGIWFEIFDEDDVITLMPRDMAQSLVDRLIGELKDGD